MGSFNSKEKQMKNTEVAAEFCQRSLDMLKMTLDDFSDADMLVRPCPGANHAAWQLGHLIGAETGMINGCAPGTMPELPAGFHEKFKKTTAGNEDASAFPKKGELISLIERTRARSIRWIKSLTEDDLNNVVEAPFKSFAPTWHHVAAIIPNHTSLHTGQFQVIRRKLGKPVLF
jgi:DinB superfamily